MSIKKSVLCIFCFIALLTLSWSASAQTGAWSAVVTPTQVQIQDVSTGQLLIAIFTTEALFNPNSCANADAYMVTDSLLTNQALASVLAAISAGKHIQVFVTGCVPSLNRPMVQGVWVQP